MKQKRFSNLTIVNSHNEKTDKLSLIDIANEFADRINQEKIRICKDSDIQ